MAFFIFDKATKISQKLIQLFIVDILETKIIQMFLHFISSEM